MTRANTVTPPEHARCSGRAGCRDSVAVNQPRTCVLGGATAPAVTAFGGDAGGETTGGETEQADGRAARTRLNIESDSISTEQMCAGFVIELNQGFVALWRSDYRFCARCATHIRVAWRTTERAGPRCFYASPSGSAATAPCIGFSEEDLTRLTHIAAATTKTVASHPLTP